MIRAWCLWVLRVLWLGRREPAQAWASIASVARARQQYAANCAVWRATRPTWWADPADAIEIGASLAMFDCVDWYAAQGQQLCVTVAVDLPPQAAEPTSPPLASSAPGDTLGELWAVRDALATVEGLSPFPKLIRGD